MRRVSSPGDSPDQGRATDSGDLQEALRASEAKFSAVFDQSPLALTITSFDDGRLIEVNESFLQLSGYTRDEVLGRTPEDLGLWVEPEHRTERFARLRAGERVPNVEARFRMKSGEERIGVIGSAVVQIDSRQCVVSSVVDITERMRNEQRLTEQARLLDLSSAARKQAEEAFRQSDERLRLAQSYGGVGVWSWNVQTDRLSVEPETERLYGVAPGTLRTSRDWGRRIHPEDLARVTAERDQALAENRTFQIELRILHASGEERWILSRGRGERDESGRLLRVLGINIDITERKRVEAALQEADRRKDEFLAMLAHELRNPLAPIRNAAQVLKLVGPADAHQEWAREVIERQTQHLTRLVDDLLDVSRITRGKITLQCEPLDLAAIVDRSVEASRPLIDARRHQLAVALPPEPVRLEGDLTRLVQVVGNLLNNAAKYTDEGGQIRIEAMQEGEEAVVRVFDNGMGLPADLLPHVFDLFTQADRSLDRSQGGLGIGLTLVRQLVEMHGGRVEARSEGFGQGSELTVRLPALASTAAPGADTAADASALPIERGLKILIVEDNVDAAEMMSFMLQLGGHEVRAVYNGPEALEAARAFEPQVVLCDIGLPGMNGYEVAARLREQPAFRQTTLIALTGYGQEEARRRAKEAGFDYHLVKPVEPDALAALLDSLRPPGSAFA
jgi:PAS domain S-box-containing protein